MRKVSRSALVPFAVSEMYSLAADVESYPEFLPWCSGAEIHSREGETVEATLELSKGGIRKKFRTSNTLRENESIDIELVGGPFSHLSGGWRFEQLGDAGSKISIDMEFEFKSRSNDFLFGSYLVESCNSLVDAFTRRASEIYGSAPTDAGSRNE
jgi:ribosome-associated toxin RatA of RatAB toxin-antitoxin module